MAKRVSLALMILFGLALVACGGDDSERRRTTPTWQARERIPVVAQHWWGEAVERTCEETTDCRSGERCRHVRLSSCERGCPEGEDARVCVPEDWEPGEALTYTPPRPD